MDFCPVVSVISTKLFFSPKRYSKKQNIKNPYQHSCLESQAVWDKYSNEAAEAAVTPLLEKPFHIEVGLLLCRVPYLCFNGFTQECW